MGREKIDRTGEVRKMNCGDYAEIIRCNGTLDIDVQFKDEFGHIVENALYCNFQRGTIKNPYHKNKYGAYLGAGNNEVTINRKATVARDAWARMIDRSKNEKFKEKNPAYKDTDCCEDWLCFQTFADWYNENYYTVDGQSMEVDKDWLKVGNQIYCPEYCSIVPSIVNSCILNHEKIKYSDLPTGICIHNNKYCARLSMFGERVVLCHTNDLNEAMRKYREEKISYIKQVADMYKYCIPDNVYKNMIKYEERFEFDFPEYKGV